MGWTAQIIECTGAFRKRAGYETEGLGEPVPPPVQIIEELNDTKRRYLELPEGGNDRQRLERRMNQMVETLNLLRGLYGLFGDNLR